MPRRKITQKKVNIRGVQKKDGTSDVLSKIKREESYTSFIIGIVIVLLVAIGLIIILKGNRRMQTSSVQLKPTIEAGKQKLERQKENKNLPKTYTVKEGDNLWTISEKIYSSGYNWVDIARVNGLANPNLIYSGNRLIIPNVQAKIITTGKVQNVISTGSAISTNTYTVVQGDNLWEIAVRAYGDGFNWTKIAKVNNLANPNIIHSGNILKIPR